MENHHSEVEQAQFVERIFLYKNQINELHQRYYGINRRMYYTYKYFTNSFKVYNLPDIIVSSIKLLNQIAPHRSLNPFLEALSEFSSKDCFVLDYNSGWLKQPFYIYSTYLQLGTIFEYLVNLLAQNQIPEGETVKTVYWQLIFVLFGRTHEEYENENPMIKEHRSQYMQQVPFSPASNSGGSDIGYGRMRIVDSVLKLEYLPENDMLEVIMDEIIDKNIEALKELGYMMVRLTVDQLNTFHGKISESTGGMTGVRDHSLIDSALNKVLMTFDGKDLYLGTIEKIAMMTFTLIKNHGFIDGNKRIGIATMLLMLRINGINLKYEQNELVELGMKTADGQYEEAQIKQWIHDHKL
ncbi:type II toxin-antitoxin system death-on-curing family toxin [Fontibacillus panacisegetis]|nr:type II toxin-antitoxin system death-on-curing family toxin [Fontibacillus solani]